MFQSYMACEGIKTAWENACREADRECERIAADEPPLVCTSTCTIDNHSGPHICQGCLKDYPCTDFNYVPQASAILCPYCQVTIPSVLARGLCYPILPGNLDLLLSERLRRLINRDDNRYGYNCTIKDRKQRAIIIMQDLVNKFGLPKEGGVCQIYADAYINQVVGDQGTYSHNHIQEL